MDPYSLDHIILYPFPEQVQFILGRVNYDVHESRKAKIDSVIHSCVQMNWTAHHSTDGLSAHRFLYTLTV